MSADRNATEAPLLIERDGAVETLVINDPPRNRMSLDFMDALEAEVARVADDPGVRAIVIRGAGDENFSVGMDLKQLPEGVRRKGSMEALFDQRLRVLDAIENLPKPVVAVLYGYCLGGGLELPLACHFRLAAAEGCKIGLPELDLGTVPAWGGSARLTRCVGRDHALDMILRAKKISGPEALRIGLVSEVWPIAELFDRAHALARELADMPAIAVARNASLHRRRRGQAARRGHRRGAPRGPRDDGHAGPAGGDDGVPREEKAAIQPGKRVSRNQPRPRESRKTVHRCLPTSQPEAPRCRSAKERGTLSSSVAMVSFQRLRKPKSAQTATSSTICGSSKCRRSAIEVRGLDQVGNQGRVARQAQRRALRFRKDAVGLELEGVLDLVGVDARVRGVRRGVRLAVAAAGRVAGDVRDQLLQPGIDRAGSVDRCRPAS